jgi:hypothetical protein
MYVAIGIGTLLLGGWVLNSPSDEKRDEGVVPATPAVAPLLLLPGSRPYTPPPTAPTAPGAQQPVRQQPPDRANFMPLAPTEAAPPGTPGTPGLSPPTQPMPEGAGGGVQAGGAYGPAAARMPMAPTYRHPSVSPGASGASPSSPYNAFTQQQTQLAAAWTPQKAFNNYQPPPSGRWTPQKAFNNYQPPPSGSSPYMNLFRTGTNNGTIDNYTTLVRPALQQLSDNQKFGNDIFGLQRNARIQGAALQQINPQARSLQGVGTPQYYMNTGGYYPGMYGP